MDAVFPPQVRNIFEYADPATGAKRFADPLAVDRGMLPILGARLDELFRAIEGAPGPDGQMAVDPATKAQAEGVLVKAVRAGFNLAPVSPETGQGVTDSECLTLWNQYHQWLAELFPVGGTGPKSAPPSAVPPATKSLSPCGCT